MNLRAKVFTLTLAVIALVGSHVVNTRAAEVTAAPLWFYPLDGIREISVNNNYVIASTDGGRLIAFSGEGRKVWSIDLGGEPASNIAIIGDLCAIVHSSIDDAGKVTGSTLRVVKTDTGVPYWSQKLALSEIYSLISSEKDVAVVPHSGTVVSYRLSDRSEAWRRELPLAADDGRITASSSDGARFADLFARLESAKEIGSMTLKGDYVNVLGSDRGYLRAVDTHGRTLWRFKTGAAISRLISLDGMVVAASDDNFIYAFDARNGDVEWKKRFTGRISVLSLVKDGYLSVASFGQEELSFYDSNDGRKVGQIIFGPDETPAGRPFYLSGLLTVATTRGLRAYHLTGI